MRSFRIDYEHPVQHVMPDKTLTAGDFEMLESAVAPIFESDGSLNGIIIA